MLSKASTESLVPTKLSEVDLARLSPAGYAMYASGGQWKIARHLAYLNRHLLLAARRDIKRLMISMPPRHGKSEFGIQVPARLGAWSTQREGNLDFLRGQVRQPVGNLRS